MQGINRYKRVMWVLDSGCSRHMTGDRALLSNVVEKAGPIVTFGDDSKGFTRDMEIWKSEMSSLRISLLLKD